MPCGLAFVENSGWTKILNFVRQDLAISAWLKCCLLHENECPQDFFPSFY